VHRAERHQRPELLDGEDLPVVGQRAAAGPREVVEEQRRLEAGGAVERDRAVLVLECRDAPLELRAGGGPYRERHGGLEQRRARLRLKVGVQLAGELPVLLGLEGERAVVGGELVGVDVVGVEDPLAHLADGPAVAHPASVHHRVDRVLDRLERAAQQLRLAGEGGLLGQRSERQHGLKGAASLPVAHERAVLLEHGTVGVPGDIRLERLVEDLAGPALDHERARLPVWVEGRLGDAPGRGATQQPLQLTGGCSPGELPKGGAQAAEGALLRGQQRVELARGNGLRGGHPEEVFEAAPRAIAGTH
jgi:hypothetical protein